MEKYVINGGNKLCGEVKIESAKNALLPIIIACVLTEEKIVIYDCPKITDILNLVKILNSLGVKSEFSEGNLILDSSSMFGYEICEQLTSELRASIFMLGALISRFKKAKLARPGGCNIGSRPIDLHIKCLKSFGVKLEEIDGCVDCTVDKIKGGKIFFDYPSVGATENAIFTAVLAEGRTEIYNPAREPEIVDLCCFLNKMGAKIKGAGSKLIVIEGVRKLKGAEHKPISDRIEAGTFALATLICGGEVQLNNCNCKNISHLLHNFCNNTCKIHQKNDIINITCNLRRKAFNITTGPYPEFPTDLQAQASVLACVADGKSIITENVFENRFTHLLQLQKMGAKCFIEENSANFDGVKRLIGSSVTAFDLRGGAAMVLAGLNAEGQTEVSGIHHIRRGYLNFEHKLSAIGASIKLTE